MMRDIRDILKEVELHDSSFLSLTMNGNGSLELVIDIDEVWNRELGSKIRGLLISSVYEISNFKIDRLNIIGSVDVQDISDYNKEFVTHKSCEDEKVVLLCIEFVAGGSLNIICSGKAAYLI
jgi:hypothetical protein